jgi:putative MFS transporter
VPGWVGAWPPQLPPATGEPGESGEPGQSPWLIVAVAALGYFVDILDLFLFNVFRIPSLASLGIPSERHLSVGANLINVQMLGLLLGSFVWGILGDRAGRVRALYGSILLYSLATLLNAVVTTLPAYAACRLLAGIGLAGELGAAITLVSETLPRARRGLGTALVAGFGLCGGMAAAVLAELVTWRTAYLIGGGCGLLLLLLRVRLRESRLFTRLQTGGSAPPQRGSLRLLLLAPARRRLYLRLALLGLPVWFVAGILMVFSPELSRALGVPGITAARCILFSYLGTALGDVGSGLLSQALQSRKRVIGLSLGLVAVTVTTFLLARGVSSPVLYGLCFALGVSTGYWAVLVTTAAEHFGTNLRATVATTIPNLVRASVIPLNLAFSALLPRMGIVAAAGVLGAACLLIALLSLRTLRETFACDLDFHELP